MTSTERAKKTRDRAAVISQRRADALAQIMGKSTDPWAKKVAQMALEGEVE